MTVVSGRGNPASLRPCLEGSASQNPEKAALDEQ